MKEMIREIILNSLDPRRLAEAIKGSVELQIVNVDYDDIAEALLEEFDIWELIVEVAAETMLPF